jgi:hypothetical protein
MTPPEISRELLASLPASNVWLGSIAQAPVVCQPTEIEHIAATLKNTAEFRLPREVLQYLVFTPVSQAALLVDVPVGVLSGNWEATAFDLPIVDE